jgi:hypothetical protein
MNPSKIIVLLCMLQRACPKIDLEVARVTMETCFQRARDLANTFVVNEGKDVCILLGKAKWRKKNGGSVGKGAVTKVANSHSSIQSARKRST